MPLHVYALTPAGLTLTGQTGPSLDAVSLALPAGVFTTLRTYTGRRIVGLTAHLARLAESRALLDPAAPPVDLAALRAGLRTVIEREAQPALRLRLTVPAAGAVTYIAGEPFEPYPEALYLTGVACATTPLGRENPRAKSTAFIAPSRAAKAERRDDAHELLSVDAAGRILEGLTSNFFAVLNGALRTAAAGVLEGVTRRVVLNQAAGLLPLNLEPITVSDLPQVTESFLTSASREVMPVVRIDSITIGAGRPGLIARELHSRYRAHLLETSEVP